MISISVMILIGIYFLKKDYTEAPVLIKFVIGFEIILLSVLLIAILVIKCRTLL